MSDNLFQERLRELEASVEEGKVYPKTIAATKALSSKLAKQEKAYAEWLQKQKEKKEKEQVKEGVLKAEGVEIEEGIQPAWTSVMQDPWSKTREKAKGTAGEHQIIAKGKDFEVWTGYNGSINRQPHYVVKNDKVVGSGWTIPSAVKDAGHKKSDITHYSKYPEGNRLNTMKEEVEWIEAAVYEAKDTIVKDKEGKVVSFKHVGVWEKSKGDGTTVDKSGAKHTPYSKARDKARAAIKKLSESEVGQIDELSKSTLSSYRDAAKERRKEHNSAIQRASSIKDTMGDENGILDKAISYHSKEHDRLGGKMKLAARKIKKIKEDVEQVSELSKTTLASYYAKSIKDRHSKDLARDSAKRRGDEKEADALGREVTNRSSGLEKAKAKFFAEELVGESWKVSNSKASRVFAVTSKEEAVSKFTKQGHGDPTSVEKVSDDRVNPHKAMLSVAHQRTTTK